jgi:predicted SnoaL-like aldol condensation-catalyzing enzyme
MFVRNSIRYNKPKIQFDCVQSLADIGDLIIVILVDLIQAFFAQSKILLVFRSVDGKCTQPSN